MVCLCQLTLELQLINQSINIYFDRINYKIYKQLDSSQMISILGLYALVFRGLQATGKLRDLHQVTFNFSSDTREWFLSKY